MPYVAPGSSKTCGWFVLKGRRIMDGDGSVVKVVSPSELPCALSPGHPGPHMTSDEAFAESRGRRELAYLPEWWYEGSKRLEALAGDWRSVVNAKPRSTPKASAWS